MPIGMRMNRLIPARPRNRSFTLLELLIVFGIIAALVAIATPLFRRTFTSLELQEAAENLNKLIAFAQQEAIVNRAPHKLSFDFEKGTYRLLKGVAAEGQTGYVQLKDRYGREFRMPQGIDLEGTVSEIIFYPDGHSDKVEIRLISKNGDAVRMATTGVLGNVVVGKEAP